MSHNVIRSEPFTRLRAGYTLCELDELNNPGSKEFLFEGKEGEVVSIFAVRQGELVRAYVNRCPHAGARLNGAPDDFLSNDGSLILCSHHGAVFNLDSGVCTAGPCVNYGLQQVPVIVENGAIVTADSSVLNDV
ncbi:Rieske (2Fe-2S) protein [Porticoccus sp. W117]|uniref:Rieske (2Fe-2S) protein n=1 Tax=Porticoccus sp. W117 TaxID=3054777 RepID=UPI00259418B2|nr:Rieske (2Fe-2S) protein [Porticoccus sp. W117]MDM3869775.1 Rieske (2Fe-2S) protein [Porticoccus sp. W117]